MTTLTDYYKGGSRYSAADPHFVITAASDWKQRHSTRAAAQSRLDGYLVSDAYKAANYSTVSCAEYYERRNA